ncbi:MAG TPA: 5-oxoprolinase subunit PxpB [Puia sp.]
MGDSAITIDLGNSIDEQLNRRTLALHDWLQAHRFPGVLDIVVAYSSVSILYDPWIVRCGELADDRGIYYGLERFLERAWNETDSAAFVQEEKGHFFRVPVCYEGEYAPDLEWVAREKGLSSEEVVALHCSVTYRVYMVGFLPGFPYMGRTDARLEVSRKPQPAPVKSGGVGIAGVQTGIYSLNSPGGWQIIGYTPLALFNLQENPPIRLQAGDRVEFYPVSKAEFNDWKLIHPDVQHSMLFK